MTFMHHTPLEEYAPFGVASFLVIVLDIVPVGLRYWSAWETQERDSPKARPFA